VRFRITNVGPGLSGPASRDGLKAVAQEKAMVAGDGSTNREHPDVDPPDRSPGLLDRLIRELQGFPAQLSALGMGLSTGQLQRAPSSGGFSLVEHACHLRDYEGGGCLARMLRMLVEESPRLEEFDGERTAITRNYRDQSFAAAVQDFASHRLTTVRILTTLSAVQLQRTATVGEASLISISQLAELVATHDRTHLREIESLLAGMRADDAADIEAIRQIAHEFSEGFNSGDVQRMMRFYGPSYVDVNLRTPVQSHEERKAYYATLLRRGEFSVRVHPDEIVVCGAVAFGRGRIELVRRDTAISTELRYLEVLRKDADGWKAVWGIDGPVQEYEPSERASAGPSVDGWGVSGGIAPAAAMQS
jgi:ketosteroid isomerase-like protein